MVNQFIPPDAKDEYAHIKLNKFDLLHSLDCIKDIPKHEFAVIVFDALNDIAERDPVLKYRIQILKNTHGENIEFIVSIILARLPQEIFNILVIYFEHSDISFDSSSDSYELHTHHLLHKLHEKVNNLSEFSEVGSEFLTSTFNAFNMTHVNNLNTTPSFLSLMSAPFLNLILVFQAMYDITVNNVLLRNTFANYKKALALVDDKILNKILLKYEHDPDLQLQALKDHVRKDMMRKMFNETLYTGYTYSVFLGLGLSIFIPFAFLYVAGGVVVSLLAAKRNQHIIDEKIKKCMHNEDTDRILVSKITKLTKAENANLDNKNIKDTSPLKGMKYTKWNRSLSYFMRLITLSSTFVLMLLPFINGMIAVANSLFSLKPTRDFLDKLHDDPEQAINMSLNINVDTPSMFAFGKTLMHKYLLQIRTVETLEAEFISADITLPKKKTINNFIRTMFSSIGVMFPTRINRLLSALYDGGQNESVALLDKLRNDATRYEFNQNLDTYLQNNKITLKINKNLDEIINDHNNRNSKDFYKLLRSYHESVTLSSVYRTVLITGITSAVSWSMLFLGVGLTFFAPFAPAFLALAISTFTIISLGTIYLSRLQHKKMQDKLKSLSDEDFINFIQKSPLQHIRHIKTIEQSPKNYISDNITSINKAIKLATVKSLYVNKNSYTLNEFTKYLTNSKIYEFPEFILNNDQSTNKIELRKKDGNNNQPIIAIGDDDSITLLNNEALSWQIMFAYMTLNDLTECKLTFDQDQRNIENFLTGFAREFISNGDVYCNISFKFQNAESAQYLYRILEKPHLANIERKDLNLIRMHFGLILIGNKLVPINMFDNSINKSNLDTNINIFKDIPEINNYYKDQPKDHIALTNTSFWYKIKRTINNMFNISQTKPGENIQLVTNIKSIEEMKFDNKGIQEAFIKCLESRIKTLEYIQNNALENNDQKTLDKIKVECTFINDQIEDLLKTPDNQKLYLKITKYCNARLIAAHNTDVHTRKPNILIKYETSSESANLEQLQQLLYKQQKLKL